jgi:hypothetical protein
MAISFGNISNQLTNKLGQIKATASSVNQVTAGLNRVSSQISGISGSIPSSVNAALGGDISNKLKNLTGGLGGINLGSVLGGNLPSVSDAISKIAGSATELSQLVAEPLRVVQRSQSELFNASGERFESLRQQVEQLSNISAFDQFTNLTFAPLGGNNISGNRVSNSGSAASKIPNPLRDHNSFNYVITLGILSAREYNNPSKYRQSGGFTNYIIRSGGGDYSKRYQVLDEMGDTQSDDPGAKSGHAEYFIEDLEFDAVIAPNPNTGVSLGTSMSFRVTEPFSMGNFIEALIGAAAEAGFTNYLDAPFCLRIDFVGWNEDGQTAANFIQRPIFMPIKIINMDFNVSGRGSAYEVKAVPMSETGLNDNINQTKTSVNANGSLVHEVLETSARSVTGTINSQIQGLEESGAVTQYDRYVICFPKNKQDVTNAVQAQTIDETVLRTTLEESIDIQKGTTSGHGEGQIDPRLANAVAARQKQEINVASVSRMYAVLKTYAENQSLMNEIGISGLTIDTGDGGNQAQPDRAAVTDEDRSVIARNAPGTAPAEKSRDYQFSQGEQITKIIEKVILNSEYARENASGEAKNGIIKWFRIDTQVFYEENSESEASIGRPPRVYVYSVVPYEADEAKRLAPNERPANTEGLKAAAAKEYNFIYTGKNEDVLDFNISFNNAFMQTAFANYGMGGGADRAGAGNRATAAKDSGNTSGPRKDSDKSTANAPGGEVGFVNQTTTVSSGSRSPDIKTRIAETFHDRITNQITDMVTAEMTIMGDPFFIPQETGNYVAENGGSPNAAGDGTMTYQRAEVFCVVNFKTPFDYQESGATMEMPRVVPQFSGLFQVWAVTNNFSGGKFSQVLKLIRRRGQDDAATTNNKGPVQERSDVTYGKTPVSDQSAAESQRLLRQTVRPTNNQSSAETARLAGYQPGQVDPRLAAAVAANRSTVAASTAGGGRGSVNERAGDRAAYITANQPYTSATVNNATTAAIAKGPDATINYTDSTEANTGNWKPPIRALTPAVATTSQSARSPNGTDLGISQTEYNALSGKEKFELRSRTPGTNANTRSLNRNVRINGNNNF